MAQKPRTKSLFALLGVIAGGFSVFSLAEHLTQFGVASTLERYLEHYRVLGRWVISLIGKFFEAALSEAEGGHLDFNLI